MNRKIYVRPHMRRNKKNKGRHFVKGHSRKINKKIKKGDGMNEDKSNNMIEEVREICEEIKNSQDVVHHLDSGDRIQFAFKSSKKSNEWEHELCKVGAGDYVNVLRGSDNPFTDVSDAWMTIHMDDMLFDGR